MTPKQAHVFEYMMEALKPLGGKLEPKWPRDAREGAGIKISEARQFGAFAKFGISPDGSVFKTSSSVYSGEASWERAIEKIYRKARKMADEPTETVMQSNPRGQDPESPANKLRAETKPRNLGELFDSLMASHTNFAIIGSLLAPKITIVKHIADPTLPFRAPHHTVSSRGLREEAALACARVPRRDFKSSEPCGLLLLDEVTEFRSTALKELSHYINQSNDKPQIIATALSCPCGLATPNAECNCSSPAIAKYNEHLQKQLDALDIYTQVQIPNWRGRQFDELFEHTIDKF